MQKKTSRKTALCGVLAALSIALLYLGAIIPVFLYCAPAVCGMAVMVVSEDYGRGTGLLLYVAVGLLSAILVPDFECTLMYVFLFGYYPLVKEGLQKIKPRFLGNLCKALLFNLAMITAYFLLLFVVSPQLLQQAEKGEFIYAAVLLIMGNIGFIAYDILLKLLLRYYIRRIRPKMGMRL